MKVPLAVPNLDGREADYLAECISSTFVSTAGPFVNRFEQQIAELSGTDSAVVTCSGTVALQMALEGLGIGQGDLVMVPSLTFIASPNSVRHSGADVWLVDVTTHDWTMDVDLVRTCIENETDPHPNGRVHRGSGQVLRALMPVMIMGSTLDFEGYVGLAAEFGLAVVVDAAAAIGTTGRRSEALGASGVDAVCYSFNGNKTVTSGGGGAVAAADGELIKRINHLITTGRVGPAYDHDIVAYNFRMTNVEAAIGVAQIERLSDFLDRKREISDSYAELAARHSMLSPFRTPDAGRNGYWFSGVVYTGDDETTGDGFRAFMVERGIDVRPFWKPVHMQPPYRASLQSPMTVTDDIWQRIHPLPCSTGITDAELDHVVNAADEFWSAHG